MKSAWKAVGQIAYYLAWPFWVVYFRVTPTRTRVLVVRGNEVLLVKNWLGKNEWSIPGGGSKRGEDLKVAVCREVKEETGIILAQSSLEIVGKLMNRQLLYNVDLVIYSSLYKQSDEPKPSFPEIIDTKWVPATELVNYKLSKETIYAIKHFKQLKQLKLFS